MTLFILWSYFWMKKNAKKYDICYNLSPHHIGLLPGVWFKKFGGKKTFVKMTALNDGFNDNSRVSKLLGLPQQRLRMAKEVDGFIALSSEIVEELKEKNIGAKQIIRIPNGVDTRKFVPLKLESKVLVREKFGLKESDFVIVFTGGISQRKGPSLVLRAIEGMIGRFPQIQLLIIGPDRDKGKEKQVLEELLSSNTVLQNHTHIIDHTSTILAYYQAGDLFVLPSLNEGMSNSMLEAMSCGLPAIVTKVSGAADVVDHGRNGYLIDREVSQLAECILVYLENTELRTRHGIQARNKILAQFESNSVLKKHLELFRVDE
ncbi:MAG: glycosyltransferase family 4 protein [Lunatimonas sp.]|nr:glycosyltransferase family 4 protein [Lunatimonas sp.]MCC5937197.1 glycosyltransferase family 4 protein [Lunatimonas sp.]